MEVVLVGASLRLFTKAVNCLSKLGARSPATCAVRRLFERLTHALSCAGTEILLEARPQNGVRLAARSPASLCTARLTLPLSSLTALPRVCLYTTTTTATVQLELRTLNSSCSAAAAVRLRVSCFETYRVTQDVQLGVYSKARQKQLVCMGTTFCPLTPPTPPTCGRRSTCSLCSAHLRWIASHSACRRSRHRD